MFKCEQGHTNHKSASAASMCNAAARTAANSPEVTEARMRTAAGNGAQATAGAPILKPSEQRGGKRGGGKRRQPAGGESAIARNAAAHAGEPPPEDQPAVNEVATAQTSGGASKSAGAAKEEKKDEPKIPYGLSEAAVRAFAKIFQLGTRANPRFRPDLQKHERRVLRADCKRDKVIGHGRVANDEGVLKSAFWFDPRDTDPAMVAKYVEAYESEAVAGKKIGAPASKGTEEFPPVKEKEKASSKKKGDEADPETGRVKGQTEAERAVSEAAAASDAPEGDAPEGDGAAAKKGGAKKGAKKGAAATA